MRSRHRFCLCVLVLSFSCLAYGRGAFEAAFVPENEYQQTFFVTPNGDASYCAPMVLQMMGAGDAAMGGGQCARVGVQVGFFYTRWTEGAANDYRYYVTKGPEFRSMPLPPDVTSLAQLPAIVRDNLPGWATPAKVPSTVAGLEWARYYDLPISFQMQCILTHGGAFGDEAYDLDIYFETVGKDQCMWDVSNICDPDDNPATIDDAGAGWGGFSFATPTLADPVLAAQMGYNLQYQAYVKRNLQDGIHQLLEIASEPRYAGRIAGFAIDPEIHYPAHNNGTPIPRHQDYGGGTVMRPFVEDYHPVMIRQFAYYLRDRYHDATPTADTNGDGVTFWSDFGTDYLNSGGFGHSHSVPPATWESIDPPRKYPPTKWTTRTRYWQEWCNFRVEVINKFIDDLVTWAIEAGVPGTRMFSHQTMNTSSYNANRAQWDNADWLDDWIHMEVPGGYSGISQYQPYGVNGYGNGYYYYENLRRRDESWGAPEYNPMVIGPGGPWATPSEVRNCVRTAWDKRGHILWVHAWGLSDYPAFDCYTTVWNRDAATRGLQGWTLVNLDPHPTAPDHLIATTSGDSYMESPAISLDAFQYSFLVPIMHPVLSGRLPVRDVRVDFQTQGDPAWKTVTATVLQSAPWGTRPFPIYMGSHADWTDTVTKLRFYPVLTANSAVLMEKLIAARPNTMTSELASLIRDKKDTPRPGLPGPVDIATPTMSLADSISIMSTTGNFVLYGLDQDQQFTWPNTFFYKDTVSCGGASKTAIAAAAPNLLGMRKTGKWRFIRLPGNSKVTLSFSIGIRDGYTSTDGVRFRVYLRDEGRMLHQLFLKEWRWNRWSPAEVVDLTPYCGQAINLFLETQGISDPAGDQSVWGEPTITSVPFPLADFSASPTSGPEPLTVNFTDQSSGEPASWAWDFENDGTIDSTLGNPTHTYVAPGTYTVKLAVANAAGSDEEVKPNYITVTVAPPVADFSASPTFGVVPLAASFTDLSTGNPSSWQWDFENDGNVDTTLRNPTHVYNAPGNYTVRLNVSNAGGSDDEVKADYITVTVVPPVADFSASPTSGVAPLTVTFTDQSTGNATSWAWDFENDGAVDSVLANPTHVYTGAGIYSVKLTVSNAGGSDDEVKMDYISVSADSEPPGISDVHPAFGAVDVDPDALVCARLADAGSGLAVSTLRCWVVGELVYDGSQEMPVQGDPDQWYCESSLGIARRHGSNHDCWLVFDAEPDFDWGASVTVEVEVYDRQDNHTLAAWTFMTAARWFTSTTIEAASGTAAAAPVQIVPREDSSQSAVDSHGNIYVVYEQVTAVGDTDIYLAKSTDGGRNFGEPVAVAAYPGNQKAPVIAVGPWDFVVVAWQDDGQGTWDIKGAISPDAASWTEELISGERGNQTKPSLAVDSAGKIFVVWQDDRYASLGSYGTSDVFGAVTSNGVDWTAFEVSAAPGDQTSPAVATDLVHNRIWVAWEDSREGLQSNICLAFSDDAGENWDEEALPVPAGNPGEPDLDAEGGKWRLVYSGTDPVDMSRSVYYVESGMTRPVRVDDGPLGTNQSSPSLDASADGLRIAVVWVDDTDDAGDVRFSEVRMSEPVRFSASVPVKNDRAGTVETSPDVAVTRGGIIAVTLTSSQGGASDVYVASSSPYVPAHEQLVSVHEDTWITVPGGNLLAGMKVRVPAGAFHTDTLIKISEIGEAPAPLPAGQFGPVVNVGPSGPDFSADVTISIPHAADLEHNTYRFYGYRYSLADGAWKRNDGIYDVRQSVQTGMHFMDFEVSHFSMFCTAGEAKKGGGGGGCYIQPVRGLPPTGLRDVLGNLVVLAGLLLLIGWLEKRFEKRPRGLIAGRESARGRASVSALARLLALGILFYLVLHGSPLP